MATDNYTITFKVGQTIGQLEILALTKTTITAICSCGMTITRDLKAFHLKPPMQCRKCAKESRQNGPIFSAKQPMAIREYEPIEEIMIKELTGTLTELEVKVLKDYRNKIITKSKMKSKIKSEK